MKTICKCFTVTLPSGKKVTAEIESSWLYEANYGADADGNRGFPVNSLEDISFEQPIEDDSGTFLDLQERAQVEKLLEDVAYNDDWEEIAEDDNEF